MTVDVDAIINKFIALAEVGVGEHLSVTGSGLTERPSVIRQRTTGVKPDYPYVTVDITSIDDESGWEVQKGIDDDGVVYTEAVEQYLVIHRVYGSKDNASALYIANKLRGYLKLASVRDSVRDDLEGSIVTLFGVDNNPFPSVDEYIESASFNLIFNIVNRNEEDPEDVEASSEIDRIELEPTFDDDTLAEIIVERPYP